MPKERPSDTPRGSTFETFFLVTYGSALYGVQWNKLRLYVWLIQYCGRICGHALNVTPRHYRIVDPPPLPQMYGHSAERTFCYDWREGSKPLLIPLMVGDRHVEIQQPDPSFP